MNFIPKIGITSGDVNGIGLELLLKTLNDNKKLFNGLKIILYCSENIFLQYSKYLNYKIYYNIIDKTEKALPNVLNILEPYKNDIRINLGYPNLDTGILSFKSINYVLNETKNKKLDIILTLPINKFTINNKFFKKGHTEYLQNFFDLPDSLMFMISKKLKIGFVTNHVNINDIISNISIEKILSKIFIMCKSLKVYFNINNPKIAILSINPHNGDNGIIGYEDINIVKVAIEIAIKNNINVLGPYSADSFFAFKYHLKFDATLAMYHDQGLIPFKIISNDNGINFTAGLPIIRISPNHGTAYDIAGKCIANNKSFKYSLMMAKNMFKNNIKQ